MSYDLFFTTQPTAPEADFADHFAKRDHFQLKDGQAWYGNEDTGVYFSFELASPEDTAEQDEEIPNFWASFNLNYLRPHTFALEAALELEAFVDRFGHGVFDPQLEGASDRRFSVEAFLRGWNAGNAYACRVMTQEPDSPLPPTRPADELKRIWTWNYQRRALQQELGDDIFVPAIGFWGYEGRLCTGCVWTDGIPVALPQTDVVFVYRNQLAPRRWLRRQPGVAIASWADVMGVLGELRRETSPLPHYFADYQTTPDPVAQWIKSLPATQDFKRLSLDSVLDA